MFGGFGGFARHVPSSDPPIPPKDQCLACGKKQADMTEEGAKLLRCSACKMAFFCNRDCQSLAWKGKGNTPDKHKLVCPELAARNSGHKLPYQVRVIRNMSGASIENANAIPTARLPKTKAEQEMLENKDLSECARDHYLSVVQNLTEEQLEQRYPLACVERWGGKSDEHYDTGDDEPGVRLEALLSSSDYEDCGQCGADGSQFFSFCLNRPVNSDRVQHCEFCHKCFYFRPGCLAGCAHCGMGYYYDSDGDPRDLASAAGISVEEAAKKLAESESSELIIQYAEDARGCNIPKNASSFTLGMASEGYWGW